MTEPKPTLIVLDLDDTLYEYAPCDAAGKAAVESYAMSELGIPADKFRDAAGSARERVKARLGRSASSHSRLLYFHESLELLGLGSEPRIALEMEQTYWRSYLATSELREGAVDLLDTMRYNGVPIAIVTDLTAQIQLRKLVYLDIAQQVDHVVCSEETVGEKEGLAPFELLAERVGEAALSTVWFVGDQDFDVPVDRLVERGIIGSGLGFLLRAETGDTSERVRRWDRLSDIEKVANESFSVA